MNAPANVFAIGVLIGTALSSCSSSNTSVETIENVSSDVIVDGEPVNQVINVLNARTLSIEAFEFLDITYFITQQLPTFLPNPLNESSACEQAGGLTVNTLGNVTTVAFENCVLSGLTGISLSGSLALTDFAQQISPSDPAINSAQWSLLNTNLSVQSGDRLVEANGTFQFTDGQLMVTDSVYAVEEAMETVSTDDFSITIEASSGTVTGYTGQATISRLNDRFNIVGSDLEGDSIGCPTNGRISISTNESDTLRLTAAAGSNLSYETDSFSDTLNCSEISTLIANSQMIFTPPNAP